MGDHTGGELWFWDKSGTVELIDNKDVQGWRKKGQTVKGSVLAIHNTLTIVDGCRPHGVMPFKGERDSLIFFVCRQFVRNSYSCTGRGAKKVAVSSF